MAVHHFDKSPLYLFWERLLLEKGKKAYMADENSICLPSCCYSNRKVIGSVYGIIQKKRKPEHHSN